MTKETARIEALSDGVFAVAITLLIFQIRVPTQEPLGGLWFALARLWPSYVAFLASFMTIGVIWLNHHRLFSLIAKKADGLIVGNLLLLLVVTWLPFPTALVAEHLRGSREDQQAAAVVYAASLLAIAIVFTLLWRYAIRIGAINDLDDPGALTRQYSTAPLLYTVLLATAFVSAELCLIISALYAIYFASPPALWGRARHSAV